MADLSSVGSWYSPANSASWELQLQPNGTARFAVAGPDAGAGTTFVSGGVATTQRVNDGQWHRLGAVRNGTELRLYRDGQMEGFWNFLNGPPVLTSLPAGGLRIGTGGCGTNPFTGQLDEITMADRAWTVAELQAPRTQEQPVAAWTYDALNRRSAMTLSNGTQTTYSYDPASQVTNILHQLTATSTPINKAEYLYNGVGNRTSLTDRRGTQTFGYDALDRLTSASHPLLLDPQAFAYDPVGNRTTGGAVVNVGNQLTADSNFGYQYDDNGNLIKKTLLATGNYTQYTYDAENRLTQVQEFAAGNPTAIMTSSYRYDGLGRRIEKVANGQTKRYVYDGEDIVLEYDGANVLQARYTHGPGIDEPIAVTKAGSTFYYHQDGLGTVTELTDINGAVAKAYAYDAYGNLLESPGTVEQPYTYTGREFDSEAGLYYYRARYYDSGMGRFLQKDPIGFNGLDLTLYAYVRNNPVILIDPLGLVPPPVRPSGKGTDICENIKEAKFLGSLGIWGEMAFYDKVKSEGPWDLKRRDPDHKKFEDFGNYHFGVMARAAGWAPGTAVRGAGAYSILSGESPEGSSWPGPFGKPPYGDGFFDHAWIVEGMKDFDSGYWELQCSQPCPLTPKRR